jgi:hypothetical protein
MPEHVPEPSVPARPESDPIRTTLALVIAALILGGWVVALTRPQIRGSLSAQPSSWWILQGLLGLQAVACLALARGIGGAWRPARMLTGVALVITLFAWVQGMRLTGRHLMPITPIVNALLFWKLMRPRARATPWTRANVLLAGAPPQPKEPPSTEPGEAPPSKQ